MVKPPALPSNIRLGCKWTTVANTLAYNDGAKNIAIKGIIVQAHQGQSYKYFYFGNLATLSNRLVRLSLQDTSTLV
jgi:hypothetical protein